MKERISSSRTSVEKIPTVIYTCFVLHKFCESFSNNQLDEAEVQAQIVRHQQEIDQPDPVYLRWRICSSCCTGHLRYKSIFCYKVVVNV